MYSINNQGIYKNETRENNLVPTTKEKEEMQLNYISSFSL